MQEKVKWFEVYGLIDVNDEDYGTETKDSFDTLQEAEDYIKNHKEEGLSIDEWESYADGTGVTKISNK
jgi:hypothetical protein